MRVRVAETRVDPDMALRSYAFDRLSACAAVIGGDGTILDTNEAWRLFAHLNGGSSAGTGRGVNYLSTCDAAAAAAVDGAAVVAAGLGEILSGDREHLEFEYPCPSPIEDRWFLLSASSAPVDAGAGAVVFHVDMTAHKLMTDRLLSLAETDLLTGLPNRRVAIRTIEEQLALAHGAGRPVSVMFFDINDFKSVNDRYGHHAGDELLAKVASRTSRAVRENDRLCRFGGDEFVLVCPELTSGQASALAERLRIVMSEPFQIGANEVLTGVSVGVASSTNGSTVDALLSAADAEMYIDKARRLRRHDDVADRGPIAIATAVSDLAASRIVQLSPDSRIVIVGATIVFASDEALALMGATTAEEAMGRDLFDFVAPQSLSAASARHESAKLGVWARPEVITLRRLDGIERAVEWTSTPVSWHGESASQITIWDASTLDLIRHHALGLRTDVADAVIVTDLKDFRIQSFNFAAEELYGWTDAEVIGRPLNEVNSWVGSERDRLSADRELYTEGRWHGELCVRRRDGSTISLLGSTTLVHDDSGRPIGAVMVNRPVTGNVRTSESPPLDSGLDVQIRHGNENREFIVHYQPVVRLADNVVIGVEALARWQHPERGLLAPHEFIDAAERSGQIIELGQSVLYTACNQVQRWRDAGQELHLAVNLSCVQLLDERLPDRLAETLAATGLPADKLWLEITETTLVQDLDKATRSLHRIRDLGVSMSIDDFGTGWASLTYLRQFPVNALKIDRLFVTGLGLRTRDTAIAQSIISLADELGIGVVAEGVETLEQAAALREMGCEYAQGFLFGRPEPASHRP